MNILIIGDQFYPIPAVEGGAVEHLVEDFLNYNEHSKKFNITVYSPYSKKINHDTIKKYKKIEFRYIKNNNIGYILSKYYLAILRRILRKKTFPTAYCKKILSELKIKQELEKYDLVIIENQIDSLIEYKKTIKSKIVNHLHNDYLNINTKNAKQIVKSCDEFWGVSEFITNQIKKIDSSVNTKELYNGVDLKKYSEPVLENDKDKMYKKIGFNKKDYILLYTGRIMPEKGILELIKAFNLIKKNNDNLKLLIVGAKKNNSKELNKYYEILKEEQKKNIDDIYFYGKAELKEIKVLYSIADIQIVPSIWEEAFGLIVIEGMCARNPLIVSDSGGMPEIVGDSAIIVKRDNIIEELKKAIIKLYSDQQLAKTMVNKYEKIVPKYSLNNYCKNFEKLILEQKKERNNEKV